MSERKSLDDVFSRICVPILLTYESDAITKHSTNSDEFKKMLADELEQLYQHFSNKDLPAVKIHLFLVPIADKDKLVKTLHEKLEGLQR